MMVSYTSSYLLIRSWKSLRACNKISRLQFCLCQTSTLKIAQAVRSTSCFEYEADSFESALHNALLRPRTNVQLDASLRKTRTQKLHLVFGGSSVGGAVHHLIAVVLGQDVRVVADALNEEVLPLPMVPVPLQGRP